MTSYVLMIFIWCNALTITQHDYADYKACANAAEFAHEARIPVGTYVDIRTVCIPKATAPAQ